MKNIDPKTPTTGFNHFGDDEPEIENGNEQREADDRWVEQQQEEWLHELEY